MGFSEDLKTLYVSGSVSSNVVFLGTKAQIPEDGGPYTVIVETPSFPPEYIQNKAAVCYAYGGAQVQVCATDRIDARDRARLHYAATSVWNRTINGVFYRSIRPTQEPWDFGLDDTGRIVYSFSVRAEISPA